MNLDDLAKLIPAAAWRLSEDDADPQETREWLDAHGYSGLDDIRGVMSLARCSNPDDFKRAGYAKVLNRYW